MLPYAQTSGRQQRSWSIPIGGSGQLTAALTGYLADHGGTVHCGQRVTRLLVEDGRCAGVQTEDGTQYRARTAVVSTIHVKHLRDMAPADAWPAEFHYGVDTYDVGVPGFATYYATTAPPEFQTPDGPRTAVSAGLAGWPEDVIQMGADLRAGRFMAEPPWLLVATPTLADPGRAPAGQHTVKLLSPQVYELPEGMGGWETVKHEHARRQLERLRRAAPGFTDDVILASLVKSPADIEELNPHMIHGAFHGGNRGPAFSGALRPVPGWASHRMPIPGLYQTGGTTHPGGSITGAPGRNAAIVLLHDLGHDPAAIMSAPSGQGPGGGRCWRRAVRSRSRGAARPRPGRPRSSSSSAWAGGSSGGRTGPPDIPTRAAHALMEATASNRRARPCSHFAAIDAHRVERRRHLGRGGEIAAERERGVLAHRLPLRRLVEVRRGRGHEDPLAVVAHVLQPGALVGLADEDLAAHPVQDLQVAGVVAADLDPADVLDGGQPLDQLQRQRHSRVRRVEQPDADVHACAHALEPLVQARHPRRAGSTG